MIQTLFASILSWLNSGYGLREPRPKGRETSCRRSATKACLFKRRTCKPTRDDDEPSSSSSSSSSSYSSWSDDGKRHAKDIRKLCKSGQTFSVWPKGSLQSGSNGQFQRAADIVEPAMTYLYLLCDCKTKIGMLSATTLFIQTQTHKSLTSTFLESEYKDYLFSILFPKDEPELQSWNSVDCFLKKTRKVLDGYMDFKDGVFFKKLHRCMMFALSVPLFNKLGVTFDTLGYSLVEKNRLQKKFSSSTDAVHCMLDTLHYLCTTGLQIMKTKCTDVLFHCGRTYGEFYDDASLLIRQSKNLSNCEVLGFTESDFLERLDSAIDRGESIRKHAKSLDRDEYKFALKMLGDLHMMKDDFLCRTAARSSRKAPLGILMFGSSSIGKSSIMRILYQVNCRLHGLNNGDDFMYPKNCYSDYWDGFESWMHTILFDDAAAMNPRAVNGLDASVGEIIQVINTIPHMPNMAALEDKYGHPMRPRLVLASTNVKDLNLGAYFSYPSAAARRFKMVITPTVRPEYRGDGGCLDHSKTPPSKKGEFDDFWTFRIERVIPVQRKGYMANFELIRENASLKELIALFTQVSLDHEVEQTKVVVSGQNIKSIDLCTVCHMPTYMCDCDEVSNVTSSIDSSSTGESVAPSQEPRHVSPSSVDLYPPGDDDDVTPEERREALWAHGGSAFCDMDYGSDVSDTSSREYLHYGSGSLQSGSLDTTLKCSLIFLVFSLCGYLWSQILDLGTKWWLFGKFLKRLSSWKFWLRLQAHKFTSLFRFKLMTDRDLLCNMGRRVHSRMGYPHMVGAILTALAASAIVARMWQLTKRLQSATQGAVPRDPVPRPNVFYQEEVDLKKIQVSRASRCVKNLSDLVVRVVDHVGLVRLSLTESTDRVFNMVCLGGQMWLANNHSLPVGTFQVTVTTSSTSSGVVENRSFLISESDVQRYPDRDVVIMRLVKLPPMKRISEFFVSKYFDARAQGMYVCRRQDGISIRNSLVVHEKTVTKVPDLPAPITIFGGTVGEPTVQGDCGSLAVTMTPQGASLLGIHVLGQNSKVGILAIDQEFLCDALREHPGFQLQSGIYNLCSLDKTIELMPLHSKSPFRFISEGSAKLYGSLSSGRASFTSKVEKSIMNEYLSSHGYETKYTRPVMAGYRPWRIAALDLVQTVSDMDTGVLRECTDSYIREVLSLLGNRVHDLKVLDTHSSINGCPGVAFIDKINRNTSMGFPWNKTKAHYLKHLPSEDGLDEVTFTDEVMDRIRDIEVRYIDGETVNPVFKAHLKDEAVPFAKAERGKTRIFTGSPVDWSVVVRKYTMTFVKLLQENKFVFESAPGTICQSIEWTHIHEYLTQFGSDRLIAGDFKAFDKKMSCALMQEAFRIIMEVSKASGNFDDDDLRVLQGIAWDTSFPLVDFNGDLVRFYGSNPSGHPLTVIINGLCNSLYMRYCYYLLNPEKEVASFRKNVALLTYGDDNSMNVSPSISFYTHTSIQQEFAKLGVVYTMADKESKSVPFITIDECSFLKRSWRFNKETCAFDAPLEHDSIEKSLMVWVRSKSVLPQEQAVDIVSSALREYFFYGRTIFDKKRELFRQMLQDLDLSLYIKESTLPSYDTLVEKWNQVSDQLKGVSLIGLRR